MKTHEKKACRLCGTVATLQESHVIPKFIYKWLKDSSASNYIRFGQQPNKRAQDGFKFRWLCIDCEKLFNKWETLFSSKIFHPLNQNSAEQIRYSSWFLLFCVSISWRVLNLYIEIDHNLPPKFHKKVDRTQTIWKEFLLGQRPHPGENEQHFLPLDAIESHTTSGMPPNINRYILRSVDIDIVHNEKSAFIYSKLGRFIILGFIEKPSPSQWKGTKLHVNNGLIKPQEYTVPNPFGEYLQDKAKRMAKIQDHISEKQNKKIDETLYKDLNRVANSESFKAMSHDVRLFGDTAFRKKK